MYQKESKQSARRNPIFKTKETVYQKESKHSSRKNLVFKAKETVYQKESKARAREKQDFKAREKVCQNTSKRKARANPYVLECERIKKQQIRQEKRKFNDDLGINISRKKNRHATDILPKIIRKMLKLLKSLSNNSMQIYLLDPCMFVHVVTRHGSGKVFQC